LGYPTRNKGSNYGRVRHSPSGYSGKGHGKQQSTDEQSLKNPNYDLTEVDKPKFNIKKLDESDSKLDFSLMSKDEQWWFFEQDMVNNSTLVAQENGKVVGVATYHFENKGNGKTNLVIDKIMSAPEFRGKGVSRALIADLEKEASQFNADLFAFPLNDEAKAFFHKVGFAGEVGVAKEVKPSNK
jgi:GNAT superfamily N-acetyltransferase